MTTRTYGLSGSGMDVDSMVTNLMKAQRAPLDTLNQKKTLLEWKKSDYSDMYSKLREFRNKTFDFKLSDSLSPMKVASTTDTVATATATGDAAAVSHTLEVTALASGASVTSDALGSGTDKTSLATQLGVSGTFNINLNGKTIAVDSSKSIYEFISAVNKADAGVKVSYDATLDRVFINSTTSGSAAKIDFSASDATGQDFLTNKLKLNAGVASAVKGTDANFKLDGVTLTESSNNFTIAGISYTLKTKGTTTVGVSKDIDKTVENVKAFIKDYNALLDAANTAVNAKRYKDYTPLTSDQKKEMTDDDIKAWETKAKSGMLRNDTTLTALANGIRNDFSDRISGITSKYNSAASIGITTGDYTENGKLYLDENKLKKALQEDPEAVNNIFGASGDTRATDGIANRMYDTLKTAMDKIDDTAGVLRGTYDTTSPMAKQLKDYTTRISALTTRLSDIEDRYYKQFDAMETALNKLNSQSSWLQQQTGG